MPTYSSIVNHQKLEELQSQWHNMLAHQLPAALPPIETFWDDLELFFTWLVGDYQSSVEINTSDHLTNAH